MVTYYGKLLVMVPTAISLGALASIHPAIAIHHGLTIGSLIATGFIFEMLFRNPPIEPTASDAVGVILVGLGWFFTILSYL